MVEIAKCPYCEHDPMRYNTDDAAKFQIVCLNCDMRGPLKNTREAAIAAWNQIAKMRKVIEYLAKNKIFIDFPDMEADVYIQIYIWIRRYAVLQHMANQALKGDD